MNTPNTHWKKATALFLLSQAFSIFGSTLVSYAILWKITLDTQSGFMMTLYILFGFLPSFFLSPFAGVWADRYDRKKLIMISDGIIALTTLTLAILFRSGYQAMWLLFVIPFVRTLGGAVQLPAVNALIPQMVPPEHLMRTNGLFASLQSGIMLLSPMISGALLNYSPFELILLIDVITAVIAITILGFLKMDSLPATHISEKTSYMEDFKAGFNYLWHRGSMKQFLLYSGLLFVAVTPMAMLTPLQVTRSFGGDVWRLTAIEVLFSLGYLLGGLLITAWGGFKSRINTMALSILLAGAASFLLGVVDSFWIYLSIMGFAGIALPLFNTSATVYLQEKVESAYHGRTFGIYGMISSSLMPISMLFLGPLADKINIEQILIAAGAGLLVVACLIALDRSFVRSGIPQV